MKDGEVRIEIAEGVEATCNGEPVTAKVLHAEAGPEKEPDRIVVGDFTFFVIKRGGRGVVSPLDS